MDKPIVLIVDDEESNLQLIGKILQHLDIDITLAASGQEALSLANTLIPDLIILDIMMPSLSGFEVCKKITSIKPICEIPIIFISAKADSSDIIKGFKLGAMDYITKPFIKEELIARVETQLKIQLKETQLKDLNEDLEKRVGERTKELIETNKKLKKYNTALQVLMDKREEDRIVLEQQIKANTEELILPDIERLKKAKLNKKQTDMLLLCEENIRKITSSFIGGFNKTGKIINFTHREMTIANMIAQGKSSQEIASLIHRDESTVSFHRNNIREKLGIKNKPVNLQVHLKSLAIQKSKGLNFNES